MQLNNTSSLEKLLLDIDRLKDSIAHQRSDALNKQEQEALKDGPPIKTSDEGLQTDNFLASLITSPPDQPITTWGASDQTSFLEALSHTDTGSMQTPNMGPTANMGPYTGDTAPLTPNLQPAFSMNPITTHSPFGTISTTSTSTSQPLTQTLIKGQGKGNKGKGRGRGGKAGSGVGSENPSLYEMNTTGAMNRLMLLIGGKKAGNTSQAIKQEAATILDWLLNNKKINVDEHKLLTQEVNS